MCMTNTQYTLFDDEISTRCNLNVAHICWRAVDELVDIPLFIYDSPLCKFTIVDVNQTTPFTNSINGW